jgi:uncharacterized phage-like protein YoqJ
MPKPKTCCFAGPRPQTLGIHNENHPTIAWIKQELHIAILKAIHKGYTRFISGGALAVDQWAAEEVLRRKADYSAITLTIARPFPSQAAKWTPAQRQRHQVIVERADAVVDISPDPYATWKMQRRNEWMCDQSHALVAVWDGRPSGTGNCVAYAESRAMFVYRIDYGAGRAGR